jgi:hypothetical protein
MVRAAVFAILPLISLVILGCRPNPASGPLGPEEDCPSLKAFAGQWRFDLDKTLTAQKAAGIDEQQIKQLRKFYADHPELGPMHPDLTIKGNVAVGNGTISSEYRFFAMHRHGATACGKAWHHEDRHDPGDMSKCFVRLNLVSGDLHLEVNMAEGLPDLNDPDLTSSPAVEVDASRCETPARTAARAPDAWQIYVFSRGQ